MKLAEARISGEATALLAAEIRAAGGREVSFVADVDEAGVITSARAVACFVLASVCAGWGDVPARHARPFLLLAAGVFYLLTRLTGGDFLVFVIYEGAGLLFALAVHGWLARSGRAGAHWVTAGLAVSLAAGVVQAIDTLSFRLVWTFDHNGIFHLVQALGLGLLLVGLRPLLGGTSPARAP